MNNTETQPVNNTVTETLSLSVNRPISMAAKDVGLVEEFHEITKCAICRETFSDPRMLPCLHTYCLECLINCEERQEVSVLDKLKCPACGTEDSISSEHGLKKNFFIARLIELRNRSKLSVEGICCDVCLENNKSGAEIQPATVHCHDCQENMCDRCSEEHKRYRFARNHNTVAIGINTTQARKKEVSLCDEHPAEESRIYCFECEDVVCVQCLLEKHQSHKCIDAEKAGEGFRKDIKLFMEKASSFAEEGAAKIEELEKEKSKFIEQVMVRELEISSRANELKALIERHEEILIDELNSIKQKTLKIMEIEKEDMEMHVQVVENFQLYCEELNRRGTSLDICQNISDLSMRVEEIEQMHGQHMQKQIPPSVELDFKIREYGENDNIVGKLEARRYISLNILGEFDLPDCVCRGVTKLKNFIYVLSLSRHTLYVYEDEKPFHLHTEINIQQIKRPLDIVCVEETDCLLVSDIHINCIWKISSQHKISIWKSGGDTSHWTLCSGRKGGILILVNEIPAGVEVYGSGMELTRRCQLPADVVNPVHIVETNEGNFIISHTWKTKGEWSLSRFNQNGETLNTFNPTNQLELNSLIHLAVDGDNRVFVADYSGDKVIVVDDRLKRSKVILTRNRNGIRRPFRLHYDCRKAQLLLVYGAEFEKYRIRIYSNIQNGS